MTAMTPTVIHADRLIDGSGAKPVDDAILVVADGKVRDVFSGRLPDGAVPPGAHTLRYPGCTILPGLIDTHVHLNLPGNGVTLETACRETDGVLTATATLCARRALDAGITTVRDVGAARGTVFDVRRALRLGHGTGARIVAGGQPITITGGHTWYLGGEADGVDGVRRKVREMCRLGADFIKVMATGGGTVGTMSWLPSYSQAELAALADEAHRQDRTITAHCLCAVATDWVVAAGFDGIEHASFLADRSGQQVFVPETAERVARAGIPCTSTLAVGGFMLRALKAMEHRSPQDEASLQRWLRMFDQNLDQFRRMREAGVTWIAGTDAGWRYTTIEGMPLELELMHQGGMPALEAITAGTSLAARVLGIGDTVGTLKAGMIADVLVVRGNPLDDLARLGDVRFVMQGGEARVQHPG
jgi:imidazolonepropionase-like amidohydrolase